MKILFITQFLPYPLDSGSKIKTYQTIKLLSKKHQIFLISFVEKESDLKWQKDLLKMCYGVKIFVAPLTTISHKNLKGKALLGLLNPRPFRLQKYFLSEAAVFIEKLSSKENFDAVYCDHETSLQYLPYIRYWQKKLKIYDEHNISSEGLFGYVQYERNIIEKMAYLIEGIKFWLYEKRMIPVFDQILTISRTDKKSLVKRGIPAHKIDFLPVPFKVRPLFHYGTKNILFMGLLSWWPNRDAVWWFYKNIYPQIKRKIPQVKFFIVGANPDKKIKRIAGEDSSVIVTGQVKDIQPYVKKAGVFVVPVRAGSGIRIKVLDALSQGLPVVSTSVGAKGLELKNGKNILVADTAHDFSRSVYKILTDKGLADKLSKQGKDFMEDNYSQKAAESVMRKLD